MTHTGEQLEATAQLERAREALGEALGQTQNVHNEELNTDDISSTLAQAIREIFTVQSNGVFADDSDVRINKAMAHMRRTLVLLQNVRVDDPALAQMTSTVARILALLYPVSKTLNRLSKPPLKAPEAPSSVQGGPPLGVMGEQPIQLMEMGTAANAEVAAQSQRGPRKPKLRHSSTSIPPSGDERRSDIRYGVEVDIGIFSDSNFFTGFSQDIGSGGLFVATYDTLPIGSKLNVNFSLPGGPVVSLDGRVRWIREYNETSPDVVPGMGVQFVALNPRDRKAINKFMTTHPPLFYDDE